MSMVSVYWHGNIEPYKVQIRVRRDSSDMNCVMITDGRPDNEDRSLEYIMFDEVTITLNVAQARSLRNKLTEELETVPQVAATPQIGVQDDVQNVSTAVELEESHS